MGRKRRKKNRFWIQVKLVTLKEGKNYMGRFWKNAEITNGRLAMIGFFALIINYGFFGWIIPGFI